MPEVATASSSLLERYAGDVANEIIPDSSNSAVDIMMILTIVMTVFQSLVQACPKAPSQIAGDLKRPSLRQQVALVKTIKEVRDSQGSNISIWTIQQAMIAKGKSVPDADAIALVTEAKSDTNLLV